MSVLMRVENSPRDYAWGMPGGISLLFGWPEPIAREAEYWLGAHSLSPSRVLSGAGVSTLEQWEHASGRRLEFHMKVLAAAEPLSLQVHPSRDQAEKGYLREQESGVPLGSSHRNYKDAHAKAEMIVALRDGFEALCGFRPLAQVDSLLGEIAERVPDRSPVDRWRAVVVDEGVEAAVTWLLSGDPIVERVLHGLGLALVEPSSGLAAMKTVIERYPSDSGAALSLMLNHVVLAAGEALWVAAGTPHAYLCGVGIELMGPSDNVLRGGLTAKHVDVPELLSVLEYEAGPPAFLVPESEGAYVRAYVPASHPSGHDVDFWLREVTGDAQIRTAGPAIVLVLEGEFGVSLGDALETVRRGESVFCSDAGTVAFEGNGQAFIAAT